MPSLRTRRLPGIRFEAPPPPAEVLPRMDVTVFVGFAASGPLHTPVALEDAAQFAAIFGADLPLAWDNARGEQVYAYLAPSVRAFFRNGGRRCWVVRVADQPQSNFFAIPGLAQVTFGAVPALRPAFAQARSEGTWSDALAVGAALLTSPLHVTQVALPSLTLDVALPLGNDLQAGDLLRLTFADEGYVLTLVAKTVTSLELASGADGMSVEAAVSLPQVTGKRLRVTGTEGCWFQPSWVQRPPTFSGQASWFTHHAVHSVIPVSVVWRSEDVPSPLSSESGATLDWPQSASDPMIKLQLDVSLSDAPPPGALLQVNFGSKQLWLTVQELRAQAGSPDGHESVQVSGEGLWWLATAPVPLPMSTPQGERLTFELWVRQGQAAAQRLAELAFAPDHPRYWGALPTDAHLYADDDQRAIRRADTVQTQEYANLALPPQRRSAYPDLWRAAAQPRFPLAGPDEAQAIYLPLAMPFVPNVFSAADPQSDSRLLRNGLSQFDARLFLDPDLIDTQTQDLMERADFLRYQSPMPRALQGIHAALQVEEATIIAVPDAIHRAWLLSPETLLRSPLDSSPLLHPNWWPDHGCDPDPKRALVSEPDRSNFLDCDLREMTSPTLEIRVEDAQAGIYTLSWLASSHQTYILQEATQPDFADAIELYRGAEAQYDSYGRSPGAYYYRLRAEDQGTASNWSNAVGVAVALRSRYQLEPADVYNSATRAMLLAVQRALLRLAAGRGDLLAVLSLPQHYRERDLLAHVATLKSATAAAIWLQSEGALHLSAPLGSGEARTFSYATVYAPWLLTGDGDLAETFRLMPPDGAMCGILARRALARGAWIAPANEPLQEVLALTPQVGRDFWFSLQEAQINLIRQDARGFLALSADTLSADPDLRPLNVRRLLILLRRLALRQGALYVFEPNSAVFRRTVERSFEAILSDLFMRGAFAGATTDTAFRVVTDDSLNTAQSVEQGRFLVELRVAPSLPLTFLTVQLLQTGDRTLVAQER